MDAQLEDMREAVEEKFSYLGMRRGDATAEKVMELIDREDFRAASGTAAPMMEVKPNSNRRGENC